MSKIAHIKPRLRRWEAAEYLGNVHGIPTTKATLAKLACIGGGPSFQKMGRVVLYPIVELDRWAETRLSDIRRHTSDPGAFDPRNGHGQALRAPTARAPLREVQDANVT